MLTNATLGCDINEVERRADSTIQLLKEYQSLLGDSQDLSMLHKSKLKHSVERLRRCTTKSLELVSAEGVVSLRGLLEGILDCNLMVSLRVMLFILVYISLPFSS